MHCKPGIIVSNYIKSIANSPVKVNTFNELTTTSGINTGKLNTWDYKCRSQNENSGKWQITACFHAEIRIPQNKARLTTTTVTAWLMSYHKRSARSYHYAKHYKSEKNLQSDSVRIKVFNFIYCNYIQENPTTQPIHTVVSFAFWFRTHTIYYGNCSKSRKTSPHPQI